MMKRKSLMYQHPSKIRLVQISDFEFAFQCFRFVLCAKSIPRDKRRGRKMFLPRHSFVRDCLPIALAQ
jgi:hypothetical protein